MIHTTSESEDYAIMNCRSLATVSLSSIAWSYRTSPRWTDRVMPSIGIRQQLTFLQEQGKSANAGSKIQLAVIVLVYPKVWVRNKIIECLV
jgi:hypothetical protein